MSSITRRPSSRPPLTVEMVDATATRTLMTTNQLITALSDWARGRATDDAVSDIYVKLGNEIVQFHNHFLKQGINITELTTVTDQLRKHLESVLGMEPCQESLDEWLPAIRRAIRVVKDGTERGRRSLLDRLEREERERDRERALAGGELGAGAGVGVGSATGQGERIRLVDPGSMSSNIARTRSTSPSSSFHSQAPIHNVHNPSHNPTHAHAPNPPPRTQPRNRPSNPLPLPPAPPDAFRPPRNTPSPTFSPAAARSSSGSMQSAPAPAMAAPGTAPARPYVPVKNEERFGPRGGEREREQALGQGQAQAQAQAQGSSRYPDNPHPQPHSQARPGSSTSVDLNGHNRAMMLDETVRNPVTPPRRVRELQRQEAHRSGDGYRSGDGFSTRGTEREGEGGGDGDGDGDGDGEGGGERKGMSLGSRFSLDSDLGSPPTVTGGERDRRSRGEGGMGSGMEPAQREVHPTTPYTPAPYPQAHPHPHAEPDPHSQTPGALASLAALQNSEKLGRRASRRFSQYQFKGQGVGMGAGGAGVGHVKGSSALRYARVDGGGDVVGSGMGTGTGTAAGYAYGEGPVRPARRVERAPPLPPLPVGFGHVQGGHTLRGTASETVMEENEDENDDEHEHGHGHEERTGSDVPIVQLDRGSPGRRERPSSMIIHDDPSIGETTLDTIATTRSIPDPNLQETPAFKVFLQFGRETKRVTLDRDVVTSIVDLQGMFISRFDYSPEGMELFPDVYIKEPVTGIAYQLEDLDDIKPDALLSLNLDPLDQVKQHFDNTITSLSHEIKDLKNSFISSRRASALKLEVPTFTAPSPSLRATRGRDQSPIPHVRLTVSTETTPTARPVPLPGGSEDPSAGSTTTGGMGRLDLINQHHEVQVLRRDLGAMRQVYLDFVGQTKETFQALRDQTLAVREVALTKLSGSRALVDTAKRSLEKHSSETVQAVEDVSDVVDAIKEDVLKRQILPRSGQMESMRDDLVKAKAQVEDLREQITLAAPSWKQTWNQELKNVVEEQHLLQHQEKLTADLEDDIKQACEIFDTLKEYVSQRQAGVRPNGSRKLRSPAIREEDEKASVSDLLLEIRTKESDPNRRLAAIEQQQKQRQKELAEKSDEFSNELSGFVAGRKLKRTGGTEEAERIRMKKQEMNFKRMFSNESKDGASSGASTPTVASFVPANVEHQPVPLVTIEPSEAEEPVVVANDQA